MHALPRPHFTLLAIGLLFSLICGGCGTTTSTTVSDQLLVSDAVDRTVAQMGFNQLTGEKVYLDTKHLGAVKGVGFVNAHYIISSLRQQLVAGGCLLQDKLEEADYVVEVRVGALGSDGHEITYGLPANNALSTAATLMASAPIIPTIPEISLAKRNDKVGAAKIAAFAYHRETKKRVWQSGISVAASTKRDVWVLGAGPFQRGTIYDGTKFAGSEFYVPFSEHEGEEGGMVVFNQEKYFGKGREGDIHEAAVVNYEEVVPLKSVPDEKKSLKESGEASGDENEGNETGTNAPLTGKSPAKDG